VFVNDSLVPYLKDLYKDLQARSSIGTNIDKVTFTEYTSLPGIINDRLHFMFSNFKSKYLNDHGGSPKEKLVSKNKEDFITQESFVRNFVKIFLGDLESKIQFTFEMYDFDNDGFITPEDIRIMMSYMPINKDVNVQNAQALIDQRGMQDLGSPKRNKEGLYNEDEGKNTNYENRLTD
jgi:hypothetical protein